MANSANTTSKSARRIIFTGGGSAGHVTLNLALIPWFLEHGWDVHYIGSKGGMEEGLAAAFPAVRYYGIMTGKLRRYFSWQNFADMAKIPLGCLQACRLVHKIKPDVIFSKGGFVSFPVVVGGFVNRRKILMHESDITPGLANKMSLPFVNTFFTTFPETERMVKQKQKVETQFNKIVAQKKLLEQKVRLLSSNSLDLDMLEERTRVVLNYAADDEFVLLDNISE